MRSLVYPREIVPSRRRRPVVIHRTRHADRGNEEAEKRQHDERPDDYRDKLIKYIPAEAIAFFTLAYASLHGNTTLGALWYVAALILGIVISWLFTGGVRADSPALPWYAYVLAAVAFIAWALGTTGVGHSLLDSWPDGVSDFILAAAIFIIPGIDQKLTTFKLKHDRNDERKRRARRSGVDAPPHAGVQSDSHA